MEAPARDGQYAILPARKRPGWGMYRPGAILPAAVFPDMDIPAKDCCRHYDGVRPEMHAGAEALFRGKLFLRE